MEKDNDGISSEGRRRQDLRQRRNKRRSRQSASKTHGADSRISIEVERPDEVAKRTNGVRIKDLNYGTRNRSSLFHIVHHGPRPCGMGIREQ